MGIDALKPGFEVMEWDRGTYETPLWIGERFDVSKKGRYLKRSMARSGKFDPFTTWGKINRQADIDFP